jgi:hypothetical protein
MKAEGAIDLPTRRLDLELAIGEVVQASAADAAAPPKRDVIDMRGPWAGPALENGTANP